MAAVTLSQLQLIVTGFQRREDREWRRTREIVGAVVNYAGWGAKDFIPASNLIPLYSDKEDTKQPIRTLKQAIQLLKEFQ